jgi:hypothetical protein
VSYTRCIQTNANVHDYDAVEYTVRSCVLGAATSFNPIQQIRWHMKCSVTRIPEMSMMPQMQYIHSGPLSPGVNKLVVHLVMHNECFFPITLERLGSHHKHQCTAANILDKSWKLQRGCANSFHTSSAPLLEIVCIFLHLDLRSFPELSVYIYIQYILYLALYIGMVLLNHT